jgi:glycosyltransferase involved in cell wall biosynthesis
MEGGAEKYLEQLVKWLKDQVKPDAVHLSNALLIGIAVKIKETMEIPVFCNLDDENFWLDGMSASYSEKGWQLIRDGADRIDSYISASSYYARLVQTKTGMPGNRIRIVPRGIALDRYRQGVPAQDPQTIGFLSRMNRNFGLDILADAFIMLKKEEAYSGLKLRVSGGYPPQDKKFVKSVEKKFKRAGVTDDIQMNPSLYREDIRAFFNGMTLLCVPARQGESFGSYILESMASGIPVVQPSLGGYPEIIENTGGGITYSENNPLALKEALSELLDAPERIKRLGRQGLESVNRDYTSERFIKDLIKIYKEANNGG